MLTCKEATRLVSESLDRPLPLRKRIALRMHLMMCYLCRRYRKQLRFLQILLRDFAEEEARETDVDPELDLPPEARERIRSRLDDEIRRP